MTEMAFLIVRAFAVVIFVPLSGLLFLAWVRNHYEHKPKRWLVLWQSIIFLGAGLDSLFLLNSRAHWIWLGIPRDLNSVSYFATGTLMAIGGAGMLLVWVRWPASRPVGANSKEGIAQAQGGAE